MTEFDTLISTIALTMGVSWASGINLYAACLMLGLGGMTNNIDLPAGLEILEDPLVLSAAGLMYFIEFFADKVPGVDSSWDGLHTFIRIPAGVFLASASVGDVTPALEIAAGLLGGTLSATSHATKAGGRLLINTSPEPVTNWTASITEDIAVLTGLWAALNHPIIFIVLLVLFILFAVWLLPKVWRLLGKIFGFVGRMLGMGKTEENKESSSSDNVENMDRINQIERLQALRDSGALTEDEFNLEKRRLINKED